MNPQLDTLITLVTSVATLYLIVGVFVAVNEDGRYPARSSDSLRSRVALILLVIMVWPLAMRKDNNDGD